MPTRQNDYLGYQAAIFSSMFVGYMLYCYDRRSFSYAMPALLNEGLSKDQLGLIMSSQTAAYSVSKFVGGVLSDKVAPNKFFALGLTLCGLSNIFFIWFDSVIAFTVLWFINGLAQGAGWPSCARVLRQWFTREQFGTWWAILTTSSNLTGGVAPFVALYFMNSYGWRASLLLPGILSLICAVCCLFIIKDKPSDVGLKNLREQETLTKQKSKDADKSDVSENVGVRDLLMSPFTYILIVGYMVTFGTKTAVTDWGQLLLIQEYNHNSIMGSTFTSMVETGGIAGSIFAGWLTDRVIAFMAGKRKSGGAEKAFNYRMPAITVFYGGYCVGLYALVAAVDEDSSKLGIGFLGIMLGFCLYGPIALFGVIATESSPDKIAGTGHAIVALGANVGGMMAGLPLSLVAKLYNWSGVFILLITVNLVMITILLLTRNLHAKMVPFKKQKAQ